MQILEILSENARLKKEMDRRRETIQHLLLTQCCFLHLLDKVTEAIFILKENGKIFFNNRACLNLLGQTHESLVGRHLKSIFGEDTAQILNAAIKNGIKNHVSTHIKDVFIQVEDDIDLIAEVQGMPMEFEGQKLATLLIRRADSFPETYVPVYNIVSSRKIIAEQKRNRLAVAMMNLCIDYWIEETGKGKFDMARLSGNWKVYINDDGWERSQTLDKYLHITTLPKKPRWKKIFATAEFILNFCSTPSAIRERLEATLKQLRQACREPFQYDQDEYKIVD